MLLCYALDLRSLHRLWVARISRGSQYCIFENPTPLLERLYTHLSTLTCDGRPEDVYEATPKDPGPLQSPGGPAKAGFPQSALWYRQACYDKGKWSITTTFAEKLMDGALCVRRDLPEYIRERFVLGPGECHLLPACVV